MYRLNVHCSKKMASSFLASAPPREVIDAVAASIDVSGSIRMECGYVGATNQRKCEADPTRDRDPRVVDIEEVQGHEDDESDVEEEALIPPDPPPPPDDGAAQMEGGEADGVFPQIFDDIVHDDDEPPAPHFDELFEGGSEENSPGSGVETRDHGDFPVAIPEPSQSVPQRSRYDDENTGACAIEQPLSQPRPQDDQDSGPQSPQQVPAEVVEHHGQRLAGLAAALQDLSLGVARPQPVNVEQLAEGIASALTIGLIPDHRDHGIAQRLEHLSVQTQTLALLESRANPPLTRAATHAEGLASLEGLHQVADAQTQRPMSHRRTLSDTTPTLESNLPSFQVWYNKPHIRVSLSQPHS